MVILNFRDGTTRKFSVSEFDELNSLGSDVAKISAITSIWLKVGKQPITLPIPKKFGRVFFMCDKLNNGERITVFADNMKLSATYYLEEKGDGLIKIDLLRQGKPVFRPQGGSHVT